MESILKRYVVVKAAQALAEIVELLRRVNNVIVESILRIHGANVDLGRPA